jgi:hypothetical protein
MTKDGWIYLVQNFLGGGSAPTDIRKKYRKGIVSEYLGMSFNETIVQLFNSTKNLDDLDSYCKVYSSLTINNDAVLGKKYIDVPLTSTKKILQLPDNKSIRTVLLDTPTTKTVCLYRKMDADQVYSSLEVNTYLAQPRWDVLGERIYFSSHKDVAPYATVTTATVKMIVPWSEFSLSDYVEMPFETNNAIFDSVVNKLRSMSPEDKIIDQNVTQPEIK